MRGPVASARTTAIILHTPGSAEGCPTSFLPARLRARGADGKDMIRISSVVALSRQGLLLLALGLTAGCGADDGDERIEIPTDSTPAEAPTPVPVGAETLYVDTIPSDTPLTNEGWGPLTIGMTLDQVVAAAGVDPNPDAVGSPDPDTCDEFSPARAPAGLLVMIEYGRLSRVSIGSGSKVRTDRGLGIGDDADAVRAAYGEEAVSTPHAYVAAPGEYLTVISAAAGVDDIRGLVYEIGPEGRITRIHGGGPGIRHVEGCV